MARPERPQAGAGGGRARLDTALTWLASTTVVVGGATLLGRGRRERGRIEDDQSEASGRGVPSTPPSRKAVSLGYETHDMSGRDMAMVVGGLGSAVAVVIGIIFAMLTYFHSLDQAAQPALTPEQSAQVEPPLPHLQAFPKADLSEQIDREEDMIHGYAWLGPDHARARIPIGRAMALTVGRSLDAAP
jgi:hypothetical protein